MRDSLVLRTNEKLSQHDLNEQLAGKFKQECNQLKVRLKFSKYLKYCLTHSTLRNIRIVLSCSLLAGMVLGRMELSDSGDCPTDAKGNF